MHETVQTRQHRGPGQEIPPSILVSRAQLQERRKIWRLEVAGQITLGKAVAAVGQHAAQNSAVSELDLGLRTRLIAYEVMLAAVR